VVRLFRGPETHIGLTTILEEEGLRRGLEFECEVTAAPLTALLRQGEMQSARFIKIDVEGAEWQVVTGMRPLLNACRTDLEIMVEVDPECLVAQGRRPEELLRIFRDAGFHAYSLENDYAAPSYLPPFAEKRPVGIRGPIQLLTDVVFSRQDLELL